MNKSKIVNHYFITQNEYIHIAADKDASEEDITEAIEVIKSIEKEISKANPGWVK